MHRKSPYIIQTSWSQVWPYSEVEVQKHFLGFAQRMDPQVHLH